ncbi:hypothetical protein EX011_21790 [Salmonella enterica]|nr:hypothetical protein [Salmonella enterica]EAW2493042.1 hypothetical protein [Salmonella enterica subsp. enterica]HAV7961537.1 hypothetical protein [Escherichia coli]EBL7042157.1 hypothetical protein [Salmonella enterica]EHQ9605734.1 hypothetical protein [Salmonella enterica]
MTANKKPTSGQAGIQIPPEKIAAARALYEAHPKKVLRDIAEETGISLPTLKRYCSAEKWRKARMSDVDRLQESYKEKLPEDPTAEDRQAAKDAVVAEQVVEERKRLLEKHKKELEYPRKLAYQAIQNNSFDTAKLAKITSETLRNVQEQERKAWGIDKTETANNITVVIERG